MQQTSSFLSLECHSGACHAGGEVLQAEVVSDTTGSAAQPESSSQVIEATANHPHDRASSSVRPGIMPLMPDIAQLQAHSPNGRVCPRVRVVVCYLVLCLQVGLCEGLPGGQTRGLLGLPVKQIWQPYWPAGSIWEVAFTSSENRKTNVCCHSRGLPLFSFGCRINAGPVLPFTIHTVGPQRVSTAALSSNRLTVLCVSPNCRLPGLPAWALGSARGMGGALAVDCHPGDVPPEEQDAPSLQESERKAGCQQRSSSGRLHPQVA